MLHRGFRINYSEVQVSPTLIPSSRLHLKKSFSPHLDCLPEPPASFLICAPDPRPSYLTRLSRTTLLCRHGEYDSPVGRRRRQQPSEPKPMPQTAWKTNVYTLVNSYTFAEHEQRVGKLAVEMGFTHVSLSSEVMSMVKAVPRGFTTAADAYLTPVIARYVKSFRSGFDEASCSFLLLPLRIPLAVDAVALVNPDVVFLGCRTLVCLSFLRPLGGVRGLLACFGALKSLAFDATETLRCFSNLFLHLMPLVSLFPATAEIRPSEDPLHAERRRLDPRGQVPRQPRHPLRPGRRRRGLRGDQLR